MTITYPVINDGAGGAGILSVDSTSLAAHTTEYDSAGNVLVKQDKNGSIVPGTTMGVPFVGNEYKTPLLARSRIGGVVTSEDETLLFFDSMDTGSSLNVNKWTLTAATWTGLTTTGLFIHNGTAASATTTNSGSVLETNRSFPLPVTGALKFRGLFAASPHVEGTEIDIGFTNLSPGGTQGYQYNNVAWRKNGMGQWLPYISVQLNNSFGSDFHGTPINNDVWIKTFTPVGSATASTNYSSMGSGFAIFEIILEIHRATFNVYTTNGTLYNSQVLDCPPEIPAFTGKGNAGGHAAHYYAYSKLVPTTAPASSALSGIPMLYQSTTSVTSVGYKTNKPWNVQVSGQYDNFLVSPSVFTQAANYANSAAPASATLSNTTASYTTLGGQWQFAAVAGAETDYALFAYNPPSGYTFFLTGVHIDAINLGAANSATTPTVLQWGIGFGSDGGAGGGTISPAKVQLGALTFPISAAVGASPLEFPIDWHPETPLPVAASPNGAVQGTGNSVYLVVIVKIPVGAATASQIIRGTVVIDGWFE